MKVPTRAIGSSIRVIHEDGTVECDERTDAVWSPPTVPTANTLVSLDSEETQGKYTSMTIGADGLPVISYYESSVGSLRVARCSDAACTSWSQATVDTPGVGEYTSIAIGTDGLPVVSYYDSVNMHLKVAKCGNAACSAGNTITTVDTADYVGQFTSITIGTDGMPIVSYWDVAYNSLKVARCGNAACSAGNTLTVVDAGGVGMDNSIAIGADGRPVISYYDSSNGNLKVAKCGNSACTAGNTLTAVDSTGTVGQYSSLTIGMDGLPVISYYDSTNYRLKVARCGNAACSSGNSTTYPDYSFLGGFRDTSISIGADGLPIVSYYDVVNADLKVAKCGSAGCTSGTVLTTLDSAGYVGQYSSITIGPDGRPVISYFDATNNALKVAKCANAFCISNWTRR